MTQKVVVVGGGLAGLTAAHELSKSGRYDVSVLEAMSTIGGRISTEEIDSISYELGAFMVFPWYGYFKGILNELGLENTLTPLRSYVQHFEQKQRSEYTYRTYRRTPTSKLFSYKAMLGLAWPMIRRKSGYYEPDVSYFDDQTIESYIHEKLGIASGTERMLGMVLASYGLPLNISMALNAGLAKAFVLNRGFDRVKYLANGTSTVTDRLSEEIIKLGGEIKTKTRVKSVSEKTLQTDHGPENADTIIFANGLNDGLVRRAVNLGLDEFDAVYTNHYTCIVETQHTPKINGVSSWMAVYNQPKVTKPTQIASIFNISKGMSYRSENKLAVYLRIDPSDNISYTQGQISRIIEYEIKKLFSTAGNVNILAMQHWQNTLPIVSPKTVGLIRQAQGKNGYYFAGDFLGSPSMETAVYNGKKVADLISRKEQR